MSRLKEKCTQTKALLNESIEWINKNADFDEIKSVISGLKDLRAEARNLEAFSDECPTLAVYGESQIGKSYFMSELLKNKQENKFYLKFKSSESKYESYFDGGYLDFLTRVNPNGGKESSGIVTRFTVRQDNQIPNAQIPVKFLSQVDLAMILADTYALDLENTTELDDFEHSEVSMLLSQLNALKASHEMDGMDESDVIDFKKYLNRYLKDGNHTIHLFNRYKIWDVIITLLPRVPYDERYKVFELFWGKIPVLTELFNSLSRVLKKINFISSGNVGFDAILPKETNNKKSSILDVGTLADLYRNEKLRTINVHSLNGAITDIPIGEAAAVIREMSLTVDDRILEDTSRAFLNDVDVYDFPGARVRKKFDVARINALNFIHEAEDENNILHECITRGKVSYLFNYYTDMNDITTLIFGEKYGNQEVNSLPKQIDHWVVNAHGSTAQERANKEPRLFISFHYFNIELNGKPSDLEGDVDQYNSLWSTRLLENTEKFFGTQIRGGDNWIEQWAPNRPIQNFFFLRDPSPAFNTATRTDAIGKETYNPGYELKHQNMMDSFLSTEAVKKYIKNPRELWRSSAALGATGTEYIIKAIYPVTTSGNREQQIADKLQKVLEGAVEKVSPFYKSGNYNEELQVVEQKTADALEDIIDAFQSLNSFGKILDSLEMSEDLPWNTLYLVYNPTVIYEVNDDGSIKKKAGVSLQDNSDKINIKKSKYAKRFNLKFNDSESDSETTVVDVRHKCKTEIFIDNLIANWQEQVENNINDLEIRRLGVSKETLHWLQVSLREAIQRTEFKQFLLSKLKDNVEKYNYNSDLIDLVSRLSKNYFNDFINTFGWNQSALDKRPFMEDGSILFLSKEKNNNVSYKVKSLIHADIRLNDDFPGEKLFDSWLDGFFNATKPNLDYKYSDGGIIKNPEENDKIGAIVESFQKIN